MRISLLMSPTDASQLARRIRTRTALESPESEDGVRARAVLLALAADLGHAAGPDPADNPQVN